MEYRFNPDGTWKTIPIAGPPDDGLKAAGPAVREKPPEDPPQAEAAGDDEKNGTPLPWLTIRLAVAGIAVAGFFVVSKRAKNK